jgi:hypothetical protein
LVLPRRHAFGLSHLGYSVHGLVAAVGIMVPTAILGMLWGVAYLLGRRKLLPCVVAPVMPSLRYSLLGSLLALMKGNTATEEISC